MLLAGCLALDAGAAPTPPAAEPASRAPYRSVEACFVLDTTGSMSSLLEAAKRKIWFIASEIANAPGRPDVRLCLLAFRDRGDDYVTRHFDLDSDLDAVYAELVKLQADGGGDTPEAVNQALAEAVRNTSWSTSDDVARLIFLVGDAPPHTDYNEPQYPEIAAEAAARGILVNPVLCGSDVHAETAFERIAARAGGQAAVLPQPGRVQRTDTVVDQDLAALTQRLDRSRIPYGRTTDGSDAAEPPSTPTLTDSAAADRAAFAAARGRLVGANDDLIEALDEGRLDLAHIEPARLPPALRSMDERELLAHLETVRSERADLRRVIASLLSERRELLAARNADGEGGFDQVVAGILARQLAGGGH